MLENSEIRAYARRSLKGKWGSSILVCLVYTLIIGVCGELSFIGSIINLLIAGPLHYGLSKYFLQLNRGREASISNLFDGFKPMFVPALLTMLLTGIYVFLWSLLLIVPGIIAALRYSQAYYILNDQPELTASEAIRTSAQMMSGHKWKLFLLYLSFIGWFLLSLLSLCIGFLWIILMFKRLQPNSMIQSKK